VIGMTDTVEQRRARTARARAVRMRAAEEKKAELLRARGWTCTPPAGEVAA
jgi:hypothetical protein